MIKGRGRDGNEAETMKDVKRKQRRQCCKVISNELCRRVNYKIKPGEAEIFTQTHTPMHTDTHINSR